MATHEPDELSPIEALAQQIAADAASVRRELYVYRYVAALLLVLLVVGSLLVVGMYRAVSASQTTLDRVQSCTDPNGECAQRSRKNTEDVVQRLFVGIAKVVECANFSKDTAEFRQCVHRELGVDLGAAR